MPKRLEVKEGERYGRLTVIREVEPHIFPNGKQGRKFLCQCDCGSDPVAVLLNSLRSGKTVSCGCYKIERERESNKKQNEYEISEDNKTVVGYTSNGNIFLIDKEDFEKVKEYCWYSCSNGYVATHLPRPSNERIMLHRFILNAPKDMVVDHINRDRTDNRKSNLRICTQLDNAKNGSIRKNNKSGVIGVNWNKKSSKWHSRIMVNRKAIDLGLFENLEDATKARKEAELKYFGEFSPNHNEIKNPKT